MHVAAAAAARMMPKSPFYCGKMLLFVLLLLYVGILPVGGDRNSRLKGGVASRSNSSSVFAPEQQQQLQQREDTSRRRALFFWVRGRDRDREKVVSVYGFNLINTLTNQAVGGRPLIKNQVIVLDDIPGMSRKPSFNIEAILTSYRPNDLDSLSVLFRQSSIEPHVVHKEIKMPFALCGNQGSRNYTTCPSLGFGTHTIKATPYTSKRNLSPYNKGQGLSITFTIVQSNVTSSTP
jgi:hypothetical protein